ncbi:MAG: cell division protein ZapA [Gemmatimonadales bacterium]
MTAPQRTVVKVRIGSDEYALRSDRSEEHTKAVAAYVDQALRDVQSMGVVVETHKQAILAALAIADELFAARQGATDMSGRVRVLSTRLERLLPPAKRPPGASGAFASEGGAD